MTKTLVYTGILVAIAILTAFLMRGVAQSLVQPGDLELAVDNERYEEGDTITFNVRLAFAKGEVATTTSVRLTVDGPQSFIVDIPMKEGEHELSGAPGLVGSLIADVQMSGVIDISSASSTPTSIISVVLKGITQGASIDISARWLPDESIDSVGDYSARLLVQLAGRDETLVSPEIVFSIDAALDSTPSPESTATSVNVNDVPPGNGAAPTRTATRTPRPTRTPTPTLTPTPEPTATPTAVATVTPLSTIAVTEDTPTSISQADTRTAVVAALASEGSLRRDATTDATVGPRAAISQPSEAPTRSTITAASRAVSTSVALRQSQRALPSKRSTPTPTHTSTATPTTTPLAFVRVSSLSRFSATPIQPAPAPTLGPASTPADRTSESGIGAAGIIAIAVASVAVGAGVIGLLTILWHLMRP